MSFVAKLWLPVVLSAAVCFVLSAASHMLLPWRRNEWGRITDFTALQSAIRGLAPGIYAFPAAPDQRQQLTPEWKDRWAKGPSGWLTIAHPGAMSIGRSMALSLLVYLLVGFMDAYVAAHALGSAPHYRAVFRIVGTVGFMSYAVGTVFSSIWNDRPWRVYLSDLVDALVLALVTAGIFGWLWPR
jgi:hypothetical protein